jgi:Cof subfamily protein (haloacid dehalogenase superfamily)
MNFQAICTDIDGTLLNKERQLSTRTIQVIKSLDRNFPVILASSRMPSAMRHLQAELNIEHHPIIAYNGGYVLRYTPAGVEEYCSIEIPGNVVARILALSKDTSIHNSLYRKDEWFAPALDHWTEREERITKVQSVVTDISEVVQGWISKGQGAHKVMCMGEEHEIHALEHELNTHLANEIHVYRSRPTYLELAPKSISKATGLEVLLAKLYDFPMKSVICFGDNYNDIDLLKCGGFGVAVANAREEVKAVATEIAGRSVEDGVAEVIEKYCFPREN